MTEKNQNRVRAFCRFAIVYVLLFVCAGNITNSMLLKWGFRDDQKGDFATSYSLVGMMNGDAPKPYVYRSSFPRAAKWMAEQLGPEKQDKLFKSIKRHDSLRNAYFTSVPDEYWTPVTALAYHLTYIAIVLSTLFALLLVYKLARLHGLSFGHAVGFLAAFSFVYPLTFQQGGYYYDFFELLGVLGACYFLLKKRMLACTLMIAVFSLNKETFFLVPLALFLLHERDVSMPKRVVWLVLQLGICVATRQFIMSGYSENAGGFVEYHVWDNLKFWVNPKSYLSFYNLIGKGIFTPSLENPLMLVPLAVFFRAAWRVTPKRYRSYFFAAFLPVLVLFIFFGYRDEARNFSVVFPAIVLIALHGANRFNVIFSGNADVAGDSRVASDSRTDIAMIPEAAR
ncbi:hypothetical protein BBJ41_21745 [Burkholderia stabilis]|uniref:hypothetical protein n=1 Tax=Burkholderia stabilis TaxID=95485 RepID=UPI0008515DC3|nr:hypothetical protein [Burkholderia stabilis]AOR70197.1 hypothetical protein BBJ41_21745 [Burkholderia stabilis]HDR9489371.1 hypothetical protein [Burkholderia stabilis]HDR9521999.1 hypothetical protein [Burkholderia stabilis]HDR9529058.1 hypothetical protein [Burkholderia stabilis]HDR9535529.1 hypothetical protein [Burkholderia stabilis]